MTFGYDAENLSYRPFGGASGMGTGGGGTIGAGFDDAGRMVVSNPGATHERTFTYDNNGNLTSINAPSTPDFSRSYIYDQLNRLTHAEGPWGDIDYTYDDVGNRMTKTEDSQTDTYAYVTGTNRLDMVTNGESTVYTHDQNGNITSIDNKALIYNQNNRLVRVEEDSVTLGEYTYNGLGQRIIKTADGATTVFHYDFDGNIIGESGLDGIFSKEYIYYGSSRLAMADVATEEVYFYGNDRLGTPQALTDSTNKVVWEANYKPFGEAEVHPNSSVENNFRFPGQYYDSETGLHYNYHRYYDPINLGTVQITRQNVFKALPGFIIHQYGLRNPQVLNLFLYVTNNSINSTDPLGLINLAESYAKFEGAMKPYLVGGALVVTGAETTAAGAFTAATGFASMPATGPAGALVTGVGGTVIVIGAAQFALGLDVYADELRRQLGLPEWFDIYRYFNLFPQEMDECE